MGLAEANSLKGICREMFEFHQWRQGVVSGLLEGIQEELLMQQLTGSFGSLNIILHHIVWAEMVWLGRVDSNTLATMPDLDVKGMLLVWKATSDKWGNLLESATSDDFLKPVVYYNTKGEKFENNMGEIVFHMIDHATYHVGQMMNAIRGFGIDPVPSNFIHYLRAKAK